MLELLGKRYLIEHCSQEYNDRAKRESFEYFCSEILRSMNNNVAAALGGNTISKSWQEILAYKPETRTGEEIKNHMLAKLHSFGE